MRDKLKYVYIAGAALAVLAAFLFLSGGGSSSDAEKKLGPEGVVEEFTHAMKTGEFEKAFAMCDTTSMKDYMNAYMQKWNALSQKDSASFVSTMEILSGAELHFAGMEEKDGTCTVDYLLEMEGIRKGHQARLRKEAGEWKVVEITDSH